MFSFDLKVSEHMMWLRRACDKDNGGTRYEGYFQGSVSAFREVLTRKLAEARKGTGAVEQARIRDGLDLSDNESQGTPIKKVDMGKQGSSFPVKVVNAAIWSPIINAIEKKALESRWQAARATTGVPLAPTIRPPGRTSGARQSIAALASATL